MELNDTTNYQRCYACGQNNPYGLQMVFRQDSDSIVSDFQPRAEHQGFPGVIHGGIIATIFDEALNRTSMLADQPVWTMTGRLEVRYRQYVPYGPLLRVRAYLTTQRGRMLLANATLTYTHDENMLLAEGQGTFMSLKQEQLDEVMKDHPDMRSFFESLT